MRNVLTHASEELRASLEQLFATDDFKSLVQTTKAAPEGDTGTFEVVITTENLDRYQEVISVEGWELEHYLANPVVLWGHDHNKIIGVCTSIEKRDGKLLARGKFAPTDEGQEKRVLYEQGFLKATSVGFIEKEREGNRLCGRCARSIEQSRLHPRDQHLFFCGWPSACEHYRCRL